MPVYEEMLFVEPKIDPSQVIPGGEPVQGVGSMDAGPGPQQGAIKEIVISVGRQSLWAYENGKLVTATLVSTGTAEVIETTTPIGQYTVLTKYQKQTMQGVINNEAYRGRRRALGDVLRQSGQRYCTAHTGTKISASR